MVVTGSEGAGAKGTFQPGMQMFQLGGVVGFGLTTTDAEDILGAMADQGMPITAANLATAARAGVQPERVEHWADVARVQEGGQDEMAAWDSRGKDGTVGKYCLASEWDDSCSFKIGAETTGDSAIKNTGDLDMSSIWKAEVFPDTLVQTDGSIIHVNASGQKCTTSNGMETCVDQWVNDLGQSCSAEQTSPGTWLENCFGAPIITEEPEEPEETTSSSGSSGSSSGNGDTNILETVFGTGSGSGGGGNNNNQNNNQNNIFSNVITTSGGTKGPTNYDEGWGTPPPVRAKEPVKPTAVSYFDAMMGQSSSPAPAPRRRPQQTVYYDTGYD